MWEGSEWRGSPLRGGGEEGRREEGGVKLPLRGMRREEGTIYRAPTGAGWANYGLVRWGWVGNSGTNFQEQTCQPVGSDGKTTVRTGDFPSGGGRYLEVTLTRRATELPGLRLGERQAVLLAKRVHEDIARENAMAGARSALAGERRAGLGPGCEYAAERHSADTIEREPVAGRSGRPRPDLPANAGGISI
jgi:hypothetical protein